jgi:alkylation response protein AidB-like acyl-CoA dehydrogenase
MASDSLVAETARRIFADLCDPQALNRAADDAWWAPAWSALQDAGLPLAWVPEALGGGGADLADGFAVLREAGRAALPLPIAETLLAGFLLWSAGIPSPKGAMACGPTRANDRVSLGTRGTLSGRLRAVPFAKTAEHLVVLARREGQGEADAVALVEARAVQIADGTGIGGDALNDVTLDGARPIALKDMQAGLDLDVLLMMGATARAMQMAGALEAILDLAVAYANERVAFGRPIAKFQAVQHSLARLAGETAAAVAAAGSAVDAMATSPRFVRREREGSPGGASSEVEMLLEVASAKIRVGEAAAEGAAIAHQVLGAIGFTREHVLHRFTRRLWAWRDDFGNESQWAVRLGRLVAANGADALWPMLAAR